MPDRELELGLDTFGDVTHDPSGALVPMPQVLRNVVAEAVLADQVGLDFFGPAHRGRAACAPGSASEAAPGRSSGPPTTDSP